ncbi:hypothetical protein PtA15_4A265 [Puccinia triticina]|uniref:Uncharacterized protein n=1 Tax=Puccinia triticina TaxID=208348 RepID=A0ABY7CI61_9BASI|nr:uncharacterized protein PtA15_4A265 [Puccinia triticina]WAQ83816.1 hypothetical protein PtA15_4A265 [Puccinia triticina]
MRRTLLRGPPTGRRAYPPKGGRRAAGLRHARRLVVTIQAALRRAYEVCPPGVTTSGRHLGDSDGANLMFH